MKYIKAQQKLVHKLKKKKDDRACVLNFNTGWKWKTPDYREAPLLHPDFRRRSGASGWNFVIKQVSQI